MISLSADKATKDIALPLRLKTFLMWWGPSGKKMFWGRGANISLHFVVWGGPPVTHSVGVKRLKEPQKFVLQVPPLLPSSYYSLLDLWCEGECDHLSHEPSSWSLLACTSVPIQMQIQMVQRDVDHFSRKPKIKYKYFNTDQWRVPQCFHCFQLILCYSITDHFLLCSKTEPFMSTESMALPCTCDNNIMYF